MGFLPLTRRRSFRPFLLLIFLITGLLTIQYLAHHHQVLCPASHRILIIGAGLAGLTSANQLLRLGIQSKCIHILESSPGLGGRIRTSPPNHKFPGIELGAEWIHDSQGGNPIMTLVEEMGLESFGVGGDSEYTGGTDIDVFDTGKRLLTAEEKARGFMLMEGLHGEIERRAESGEGDVRLCEFLSTYFENERLTERDRALLMWHVDALYELDFATPLCDVGLGEAVVPEVYEFDGGDRVLGGGFGEVIDKLAEGVDVRVGEVVREIRYDEGGVRVVMEGGRVWEGAVVVVTPSVGVLKSGAIQFKPELPARRKEILESLTMATFTKIWLRFDHAFWNSSAYTFGMMPDMTQRINWSPSHIKTTSTPFLAPLWGGLVVNTMATPGKKTDDPVLMIMVGGDSAVMVDRMKDEDAVKDLVGRFREVFGDDVTWPRDYFVQRWSTDPNHLGAYTGSLPPNLSPSSLLELSAPLGRLYFAGEWAHADAHNYRSTAHGAVASGMLTAKEVGRRADVFEWRRRRVMHKRWFGRFAERFWEREKSLGRKG